MFRSMLPGRNNKRAKAASGIAQFLDQEDEQNRDFVASTLFAVPPSSASEEDDGPVAVNNNYDDPGSTTTVFEDDYDLPSPPRGGDNNIHHIHRHPHKEDSTAEETSLSAPSRGGGGGKNKEIKAPDNDNNNNNDYAHDDDDEPSGVSYNDYSTLETTLSTSLEPNNHPQRDVDLFPEKDLVAAVRQQRMEQDQRQEQILRAAQQQQQKHYSKQRHNKTTDYDDELKYPSKSANKIHGPAPSAVVAAVQDSLEKRDHQRRRGSVTTKKKKEYYDRPNCTSWIAGAATVALLVIGAVAVVMVLLLVFGRGSSYSTRAARSNSNGSGSGGGGGPLASSVTSASDGAVAGIVGAAQDGSNNNASAPTDAPDAVAEPPTEPFTSAEELMDAVDIYLQNHDPETDLVTSLLYKTYGYPIGSWDVSRVNDLSFLFSVDRNHAARRLSDANLGGWNVSAVTDMTKVFYKAKMYEGQGLENWDTSSVRSMDFAFAENKRFNGGNLGNWDVSKVTSMFYAFYNCVSFDGDLSRWNVGMVENFAHTFFCNREFRGLDLSKWNVSSARDMTGMFEECQHFTGGDISKWDVSRVESFRLMFRGACKFDQNLCAWGDKIAANGNNKNPRALWLWDMFGPASGCPEKRDPDPFSEPISPLCHSCTAPGVASASLGVGGSP